MITNIYGDILTSPADNKPVIVCHQVNCLGVMGGGLAKQIKDKFPNVYQVYRDKCKSGFVNLGDVQFCSVLNDSGYIIANCFAQYGFGRDKCYTQYDALNECLKKVHEAFPNDTIRIPFKIGCGLGGGDWNVVKSMIDSEFRNPSDMVEIWQLP